MKKYTYHVTHNFTTEKNEKVSFVSQLYQVGVYAIINSNAALQFNLLPSDIVKTEKKLTKDFNSGKITDLRFGREITVSDSSGFWEEV